MKKQEKMRIVFNTLTQLEHWENGPIHPKGPWSIKYIATSILKTNNIKTPPTKKQLKFVSDGLSYLQNKGEVIKHENNLYGLSEKRQLEIQKWNH